MGDAAIREAGERVIYKANKNSFQFSKIKSDWSIKLCTNQ